MGAGGICQYMNSGKRYSLSALDYEWHLFLGPPRGFGEQLNMIIYFKGLQGVFFGLI